ncbi:MAG: hypothetical protein OEY41_01390 [Acidimicrobiia bacterium]|nr:hypothetical protein [Acidimicrobiia bacterium]MDH4366186.1 hypothetical protein [Acidimicrobiia bacterium]MDH5288630.1 hypothetical protein [Acidimicrobiia bacterium]
MGVWDTVRSWFKSEAAELAEAKEDLEARLDHDLTRRERQLDETPAETMERLQREAADGDTSFSAISDKIDAAAARAAAAAKAEAEAGTPAEIDPDFLDGRRGRDGGER